jgi:hypothetical protein
MAGASSPQSPNEAEMIKGIREAGRTPVQRNTFYEPIKVLADGASSVNKSKPPSGKTDRLTATIHDENVLMCNDGRCFLLKECECCNMMNDEISKNFKISAQQDSSL